MTCDSSQHLMRLSNSRNRGRTPSRCPIPRLRSLTDSRDDSRNDIVDSLVLPESKHAPPALSEYRIRSEIPFPISSDLGVPPAGIGLRHTAVNGTPVPEASVEENRNPSSRPNYVAAEALIRQKPSVNSESVSPGMKLAPYRQLDLCTTCFLVPHLLPHTVGGRRQMIRHRSSHLSAC